MDQDKDQETFKIPSFNFGLFLDKLKRINKKAKKLNLPEVGYEEVGRVHVPAVYWWEHSYMPNNGEPPRSRPAYDIIEIKAVGETPYLKGWKLIGVLEYNPSFKKPMLHSAPGQTIPHEYREGKSESCDHCKSKRFRKDCFIIQNVESGQYMQVGRKCLADFLPGITVAMAAALCSSYNFGWVKELEECGDNSHAVRWDEADFDLLDLWTFTSAIIRNDGWVSKTMLREQGLDGSSTSDDVLRLMNPPEIMTDKYRQWAEKRMPDKADRKLAEDTLVWLREQIKDTSNDYFYNLSILVEAGSSNYKNLALAVSAVASYQRHLNREAEKAGRKKLGTNSEYQGELKERLRKLKLSVFNIQHWDSMYGVTTFMAFVDENDNVFTWKSTNPYVIDRDGRSCAPERGEKYLVTGTVKKHENYKGTRQTVLTRCRIEDI